MKTISKRELNQQTARVLAAVADGEPVVVTERGVPRWRIDVVYPTAVDRLRAQGRITPAQEHPEPWDPQDVAPDPERVDRLLDEIRGDR